MNGRRLSWILLLCLGCAGATAGGGWARDAEAIAPAIEARTGTRPASVDVDKGKSVTVRFASGMVRGVDDSTGARHATLTAHTVWERYGRAKGVDAVIVRYEPRAGSERDRSVFTFPAATLDSIAARYY